MRPRALQGLVKVLASSEPGFRLPCRRRYLACVRAALWAAGLKQRVWVGLRAVSETTMQQLNRDYRSTDQPTNVLAFPGCGGGSWLGDLVLAPTYLERQAPVWGVTVESHWAHLLVHGSLHLMGHDHQTDGQTKVMERLERLCLESLGLWKPIQGV